MAETTGQPLRGSFGAVNLTQGGMGMTIGPGPDMEGMPDVVLETPTCTTIEVEGALTKEAESFWEDLAWSAAETMEIWPWGRRWFLPCIEIRGVPDWERGEDDTYNLTFTGVVAYILDDRIHARLLRWFWIKIKTPIGRWWYRRHHG